MEKHTKEEIMESAWDKCNCDTLEQMQGGLIVELLCDIRDEQERHNKKVERLAILRRKGI